MKFSNHKAAKPSDFAAFDADAKKRVMQSLGKQPLHFETNKGQVDAQVKFLSRGNGYALFLTSTESVLALSRRSRQAGESSAHETTVVRMKWKGADPLARVAGMAPLAGKSNYLIGSDPAAWRKDVPSFEKVRYENLYPGIDLMFYGNQQQLEYDFVVAPGSDPEWSSALPSQARTNSTLTSREIWLFTAARRKSCKSALWFIRKSMEQDSLLPVLM